MRRLLLICFLVTIFLGITIGVNAKYMWSAGTTGEGSTGYVAIGILSEIVNTYAGKGEDIFMSPVSYTTSLVGLKAFDQKEVVSMYSDALQLGQIINREGVYSPKYYEWSAPFAQMMWMYDIDYFFIIRKKDADKIKSWSDFANRSMFPQMRGTGGYEVCKLIFGPDGLNIWDTIDEKTFERSHAADALKLKEVDVVFAYSSGGVIVGYAQEVLSRTDSMVVEITPEELEKVLKAASFLSAKIIDPDYYMGQDVGLTKPLKVPVQSFVNIVNPDIPEEIVYQVVKAAFENATEMARTVQVWANFSKDPWGYNLPLLLKHKKMGIAIHPGALRYFRELGHDTKILGLE